MKQETYAEAFDELKQVWHEYIDVLAEELGIKRFCDWLAKKLTEGKK